MVSSALGLLTKKAMQNLIGLCPTVNNSTMRAPTRRTSMLTYYDSQSGLHVPVHNEREITLILDKTMEESSTSSSSFVPAQLYKETEGSGMTQKLLGLKDQGIHGLILPPVKFPRDLRNLQTLSAIAPTDFIFFSSFTTPSDELSSLSSSSSPFAGVSAVIELSPSTKKNTNLEVSMTQMVKMGIKTTLSIREDFYGTLDPISVASEVAKLVDSTRGGDFCWLSAPFDNDHDMVVDSDYVIDLCEELMYLDVAGPTIKSRLVIDSRNEEIIEETMLAGVNKFVIQKEEHIDLVEEIAKWQGKEFRRT